MPLSVVCAKDQEMLLQMLAPGHTGFVRTQTEEEPTISMGQPLLPLSLQAREPGKSRGDQVTSERPLLTEDQGQDERLICSDTEL